MKTTIFKALLAVFLLTFATVSYSQEKVTVTGKITNASTGEPFGVNEVVIDILAFDTEALAKDALPVLISGTGELERCNYVMPPDKDGFYTATLPSTGALIFSTDISNPILVKVNHRSVIDVAIQSMAFIGASSVSAHVTGAVGLFSTPPIASGNQLRAVRSIWLPHDIKGFKADKSRVVLKTYLVDYKTNDTITRLDTHVYEGSKYRTAKQRRRGYTVEKDILFPYVKQGDSSLDHYSVEWRDTIELANSEQPVRIMGQIQILDVKDQLLYERDSMLLASPRVRKPMRFLDYTFDTYELDAEKYHVLPKAEFREAKESISINFPVNQDVDDSADEESMDVLNGLKNKLLDIADDEYSHLLEFSMSCVSSPDGPFDKNRSLAQQRLRYSLDQVWLPLPKRIRDRVYCPGDKAVVATWTDVADSLDAQGLKAEAEDLRSIVSRYEDDMDKQWQEARNLPYYKEKISPVLDRMRRIELSYKYEELRAHTADEILSLYYNDPDYRDGSKHFAVPQYWQLFKELEERGVSQDELDALYKRACRETLEDNGRTWIYAANKYAVSCMTKGIADTTLLAPHIDKRFKCNSGRDKYLNPDAVVANQLRMYLMSNDFYNASLMAYMLPAGDKYKTLKAVTMCLGGYYQGGETEEEKVMRAEWANTVMETSPRNKVVMLLAMNTRAHTLMAEKELANMPETDPLTWYFKAVISCRKFNYPNSDFMEPYYFEEALRTCFDMDKRYIAIAKEDGDIDENLLKDIFKYYPEYEKF